MSSRTDSFTRADTSSAIGTPSDSGAAWEQLSGTWGIASNQGYESAGTNNCACVLETSEADTTDVHVTFTDITAAGYSGMALRAVDNNNYIMVRAIIGENTSMFKKVAGSFSLVTSGATQYADGDVMKCSADAANLITVHKNGSSFMSATISDGATNTKFGLFSGLNAGGRYDDFEFVGTAGGGAGPIIKRFGVLQAVNRAASF